MTERLSDSTGTSFILAAQCLDLKPHAGFQVTGDDIAAKPVVDLTC